MRGTLADGRRSRSPARWPARSSVEKLVEVDGYDVDLAPADHMAFFRYEDRPGRRRHGRPDLSARPASTSPGMQVARDHRGGHALVALTVDSAIPAPVLDEIAEVMQAVLVRTVELTQP